MAARKHFPDKDVPAHAVERYAQDQVGIGLVAGSADRTELVRRPMTDESQHTRRPAAPSIERYESGEVRVGVSHRDR
jgi:hypothetical protein